MDSKVRQFNNLPRPRATPTGLDNHWLFGVRHVSLRPSGDLVIAVHRTSNYVLSAGPAQINTLSSITEQAEALVPLLLEAFIKGGATDHPRAKPFAPASWAVDDATLAEAVAARLRQVGVHEQLCTVAVCSPSDVKVLDTTWGRPGDGLHALLLNAVGGPQPGDSSVCHGCWGHATFFQPSQLSMCAGCKKACYHSKDCQKDHWKKHKPICLANRSSNHQPSTTPRPASRPTALADGHTYYNQVARNAPEAASLLRDLNLVVAGSNMEGLAKPLRRLVMTGQDTPENMELLFGPNWKTDMSKDHRDARLEVLLDPPRGSPSYAMNKWVDSGFAPAGGCSPRPATGAEEQTIAQVRQLQEAVRQRIGAGRSPSTDDMRAVLLSTGPANEWAQRIPIYTLAVNTMDQGVNSDR